MLQALELRQPVLPLEHRYLPVVQVSQRQGPVSETQRRGQVLVIQWWELELVLVLGKALAPERTLFHPNRNQLHIHNRELAHWSQEGSHKHLCYMCWDILVLRSRDFPIRFRLHWCIYQRRQVLKWDLALVGGSAPERTLFRPSKILPDIHRRGLARSNQEDNHRRRCCMCWGRLVPHSMCVL